MCRRISGSVEGEGDCWLWIYDEVMELFGGDIPGDKNENSLDEMGRLCSANGRGEGDLQRLRRETENKMYGQFEEDGIAKRTEENG